MSSESNYPHIEIDVDGSARLDSTRYKVIHLAAEHFHYGWTAEELLRQDPDLRPEEVYAALTYFYDHYARLVADIQSSSDHVARFRTAQNLSRAELLKRREMEST